MKELKVYLSWFFYEEIIDWDIVFFKFYVLSCFFFFFVIRLPLSFVSSKILVYNNKLRIKGLIK